MDTFRKNDELGIYEQLRENAGFEALEATKENGPKICGLFDETSDPRTAE